MNSDADRKQSRWSDLWHLEDWWAVWIGFALLGAVVAGTIDAVPRVGPWTLSPLDAMSIEVAIQVAWLGAGLAALTGLGVAISGGRSARRYLAGLGNRGRTEVK